MPNPQQPVTGEALVLLCAQKINQRDSDARNREQRFREAQELSQRVLLLTSEIADITEAIKAGGSWPPAQAAGAPAIEGVKSPGEMPRPETQPV